MLLVESYDEVNGACVRGIYVVGFCLELLAIFGTAVRLRRQLRAHTGRECTVVRVVIRDLSICHSCVTQSAYPKFIRMIGAV